MNNDKAFAVYALLLIGGLVSLLTALTLSGVMTLPPLAQVLEHLAQGLSIRAAYKWIGGWDWADWSLVGDAIVEPVEEALPVPRAA